MSEVRVAGGLDKGFARLAAMRRLFAGRNPRELPDYGRRAAAAWVARNAAPVPAGIRVEQINATFRGHRILPPGESRGRLLYIHGGGLVYYDSSTFLPFLADLALVSRMEILALDYPKAPEHSANDILASVTSSAEVALRELGWAGSHGAMMIAGDSVGALLAMILAHGPLRGRFDAMHLIYPVADAGRTYPEQFASGHFLDKDTMNWFGGFIEPLFVPLGGSPCKLAPASLRNLPPCTIHLAAFMHRSLIMGACRRVVGFFEKPAQGDPPRRFSVAEMV